MNLSPAQFHQSLKSLAGHVSGDVFSDEYRRRLYATDASIYQILPVGVVLPRQTADVVTTIEWCAENNVSVIPRGAGTSLSGQSIGAGVVIDFSPYMNRVLDINAHARTARVEPGVVLDHLNAQLAKHGLQFAPEVATSSRATIGGMIGNNSAGARSILHGKTVDHTIALEAVLAEGEIIHCSPCTREEVHAKQMHSNAEGTIYRDVDQVVDQNRQEILEKFPNLLRRVSGYNLDEFVTFDPASRFALPPSAAASRARISERFPAAEFNLSKLLVGAEGTLATVTEAELHLTPLPKLRALVSIEFDSIAAAVGAVNEILSHNPSAVELLDGLIVRLAQASLEYRHYLDFVASQPETLLLVEFASDDPAETDRRSAALAAGMRTAQGVTRTLAITDPAMCAHVWACRKAALPLLMGIPGARKPIAFVEDAAVPPARLPEFVARFRELIERAGTTGAFYGHASVGCLHIRPMLSTADAGDLDLLESLSREVCSLVMEFGGAMSGEHGDGLARSYLNERLFGAKLYQAFRQIKGAFDPANRMNPGKIVEGPSPIANLRRDPADRPLEIVTTFDYSREGGFVAAAELCNGAGVCRKTQTGTMCPSFMVTLDEEHSTRGRANALRQALSGRLPAEEVSSDRLKETFDLCLQCKGCKAECPSNVDVAKLKSEFLSLRRVTRGTSWGDFVMGHAAQVHRLGSAMAPVSNWIAGQGMVRRITERFLGIDHRRPLPRFERSSFEKWFGRREKADGRGRTPIVLLDDCLNSYCEPQVNKAATVVLEAAGHEVHRAALSCCGRAMISKGMLAEAQALARENVAKLLPWVKKGALIVGAEPSCLLTLVDEYVDLVPGDDAKRVAESAMLIDDYLVRSSIELDITPDARSVILHGHCHQKALIGLSATHKLLSRGSSGGVTVVDSGCCGMAGSFGYEHYDISMQIGERVLFPAVRSAEDAVIAAPGFSCRQQILHGTGRKAVHPIQIAAEQITGRRGF